jgi:hypothetical protein
VTESTVRVKLSDGEDMGVGMDALTGEVFESAGLVSEAVQPQRRMNTTIRNGEKIRRIFMNRISTAGQIYLTKQNGGAGSLAGRKMTAPKATYALQEFRSRIEWSTTAGVCNVARASCNSYTFPHTINRYPRYDRFFSR